jgi:hypothetical protein
MISANLLSCIVKIFRHTVTFYLIPNPDHSGALDKLLPFLSLVSMVSPLIETDVLSSSTNRKRHTRIRAIHFH